jgi:hypothetical protein
VKISTDGVTASVYYVKREQNAVTYSQKSEEKKETKRAPEDQQQLDISLLPRKSKSLFVLFYCCLGCKD